MICTFRFTHLENIKEYDMNVGNWIQLGSLVLVVIGFAIKYGELKNCVKSESRRNDDQDTELKTLATKFELSEVAMRQKEDRDKNDKRFEELYKSRNEHESILATISTNMQNLVDAFSDFKKDIGLRICELKSDIHTLSCGS